MINTLYKKSEKWKTRLFPLFFYSTTACWTSTLISKTYTLFVCIKQLINMPLLNVITIRFSLVLMQHSFVPENQILQTECLVSSCLPQPCCQMECLSCSTFVSDHEMRFPQLPLAKAAHRTQGNSYLKV